MLPACGGMTIARTLIAEMPAFGSEAMSMTKRYFTSLLTMRA